MNKRRGNVRERRSTARRWHVAPPLIHGSEALEGGGILSDWTDPSVVVLWQAHRDAMLWTITAPEDRARVFRDDADAPHLTRTEFCAGKGDPRVVEGLRVLRSLSRQPTSVTEEAVEQACRSISEWAYGRGKFRTALAFAQNAALASGNDPAAAYWVATIAARMNDHARAEGWFRRSVGLARRSRDWRTYSRAFGGLGNLYIRRGNLPAARRLHTRALRGARRGGMRREQAAALHDLFVVAIETGNACEAERLARQALEAFGTRNRRIHILAHDVAYFWMEHGHFARALDVFLAVLPLVDHPVERVLVLANVARAAASVGDRPAFADAVAAIDADLSRSDLRTAAGRALLEVARGHLALEEYELAESAALGALASATEFRESKIQFAAEALIADIRVRAAAVPRRNPSPDTPSPAYGDELAADFVKTLETIAGATR